MNVAATVDGPISVAGLPATVTGHVQRLTWLQDQGNLAKVSLDRDQFLRGLAWRATSALRVWTFSSGPANHKSCWRTGKSDPADATEVVRAALAQRGQGAGKSKDGNVEAHSPGNAECRCASKTPQVAIDLSKGSHTDPVCRGAVGTTSPVVSP